MINKLWKLFSTHGIPETVVSDNGPQFASEEFTQFAKQWEFQQMTSSPLYPQSNGKVENAVRTGKRIMKTAKKGKSNVYLAILGQKTPTEDTGTSPVQKLFARRTRTLLSFSDKSAADSHCAQCQATVGDCTSKASFVLQQGLQASTWAAVWGAHPHAKTWTLGKVLYKVAPRSYRVECGGIRYRRNRRQLRGTTETLPLEVPETSGGHHEGVQEADHKVGETVSSHASCTCCTHGTSSTSQSNRKSCPFNTNDPRSAREWHHCYQGVQVRKATMSTFTYLDLLFS